MNGTGFSVGQHFLLRSRYTNRLCRHVLQQVNNEFRVVAMEIYFSVLKYSHYEEQGGAGGVENLNFRDQRYGHKARPDPSARKHGN